jgi:hypothetical protein
MSDVQIRCVTKSAPQGGHECITHVGNPLAGWRWPKEDVIRSIESGTNTFYVLDVHSRKRADVGVVRPTDGRKPYLQTYADGVWNNNLLSLPAC